LPAFFVASAAFLSSSSAFFLALSKNDVLLFHPEKTVLCM